MGKSKLNNLPKALVAGSKEFLIEKYVNSPEGKGIAKFIETLFDEIPKTKEKQSLEFFDKLKPVIDLLGWDIAKNRFFQYAMEEVFKEYIIQPHEFKKETLIKLLYFYGKDENRELIELEKMINTIKLLSKEDIRNLLSFNNFEITSDDKKQYSYDAYDYKIQKVTSISSLLSLGLIQSTIDFKKNDFRKLWIPSNKQREISDIINKINELQEELISKKQVTKYELTEFGVSFKKMVSPDTN